MIVLNVYLFEIFVKFWVMPNFAVATEFHRQQNEAEKICKLIGLMKHSFDLTLKTTLGSYHVHTNQHRVGIKNLQL